MKAVLISIQPKWCELIASGKKTIEVRKTRPKLETPFKCYIYETKGKSKLLEVMKDGAPLYGDTYHGEPVFIKGSPIGRGKVIGEFVCDSIECVNAKCSDSGIDLFYHDCEEYGCLTQKEVEQYFGVYDEEHRTDLRDMKGNGYAWHISDLKIYDKPKQLSEFATYCERYDCEGCRYYYEEEFNDDDWRGTYFDGVCGCGQMRPLSVPQSWCYVEGV